MANDGLRVLLWLCHIEAHADIPRTVLVDAGLQANVVGGIVNAAVDSWKAAGNELTSEGLLFLSVGPSRQASNATPGLL